MDSRELVQLAKALTSHENVTVVSVTIAVEKDGGFKDYILHSNNDLFRPFHVEGLGFDDPEAVIQYLTQ
jgi:hypothetical protein